MNLYHAPLRTQSNTPLVAIDSDQPQSKNRQRLYLWLGHGFVALGFIGMVLPVMPTTVFWIIAAVFYAKSSPEHYQRLVGHRRYGQVIKDYIDHGVISRKGKYAAWLGMLASAVIILLLPLGKIGTIGGLIGLVIAATYVGTRPELVPITVEESAESSTGPE